MASKMPQVLKVTKMEYRGPPGKKKLVAKNLIRMSQDEMYCQTIPTSATMLRQRRHRQEVEATSHLRLRQTKTSKETMQLQGMCVTHGAKMKQYNHKGCTNHAKKGRFCWTHGAKVNAKLCSHDGCSSYLPERRSLLQTLLEKYQRTEQPDSWTKRCSSSCST